MPNSVDRPLSKLFQQLADSARLTYLQNGNIMALEIQFGICLRFAEDLADVCSKELYGYGLNERQPDSISLEMLLEVSSSLPEIETCAICQKVV